jgi:hypothetical protein
MLGGKFRERVIERLQVVVGEALARWSPSSSTRVCRRRV